MVLSVGLGFGLGSRFGSVQGRFRVGLHSVQGWFGVHLGEPQT